MESAPYRETTGAEAEGPWLQYAAREDDDLNEEGEDNNGGKSKSMKMQTFKGSLFSRQPRRRQKKPAPRLT